MSSLKRTKENAKAEMFNKRSKDKVVCDTRELKQHITDWCHNEVQEFDVFADVLEAVGFSMPVKLSNFDITRTPVRFQCNDASGKEVLISLISGDWLEFCSVVAVTEKESGKSIVHLYDVSFDCSSKSQESSTPIIELSGEIICDGDMKIAGHFSGFTCTYHVAVDDSHHMELTLHKSAGGDCRDSTWGSKYSVAMLEHLSKFDFKNFDADELYTSTTKIMQLKGSDIRQIFIKYEEVQKDHTKCTKESTRCLAMLSVIDNVVDRYSYTENGKSYFVSRYGDWSYSSEDCEIEYSKNDDKLNCSMIGNEEKISKIDLPNLISSVKEKLKWDKVGL